MKKIIFILVVISACTSTKQKYLIIEESLYTEAFCTLMKAKYQFNTPNVMDDTLFILDEYYMDTTSIYYNQMNVMFEIGYIDSINFPSQRKGPELWSTFENFSAQRDIKYHHSIYAECFDTMKINFIPEKNVVTTKQKYNTYLYSPLIKINEDYYKIYEHEMIKSAEYYDAYILKRVDNHFEFVRRRYYSEMFWPIREDYMKTIDFNQTYEEFLASRK